MSDSIQDPNSAQQQQSVDTPMESPEKAGKGKGKAAEEMMPVDDDDEDEDTDQVSASMYLSPHVFEL